jgi:hypothetical protein
VVANQAVAFDKSMLAACRRSAPMTPMIEVRRAFCVEVDRGGQLPVGYVIRPQSRASKRGHSTQFRQADVAALIGRNRAYSVLL